MDYLPIFLAVRNKLCVVIGGGEVAVRKVALLQQAAAQHLLGQIPCFSRNCTMASG